MVKRVVIPKKKTTTSITPNSCWAAGYITRGIKGSQGPKIKMINRIQGVILSDST